ncbi:CAP domain-containing protein [Flavobacterium sp. K5-23]|uniref:CAP domain-containing protein n=1 Tax=Flavobacterium sp. K5-23 TaxID=2746225 RepID=UPI00200E848F|nr:CAP domain-containing protein [Flavobacterium sp. K5-23]UQD57189.1 CAP domain-containing protein [Flavobacterium sp. K5-23]
MKTHFLSAFALISLLLSLNSCSTDTNKESETSLNSNLVAKSEISKPFSYSLAELETLKLINDYRVSIGLNQLEKTSHISFKSEEHNDYMITNTVFNHNDFNSRSENIKLVLGAKTVGENIAFNFKTPKDVLSGWLNSPTHKANIEGNFTHFGISIKTDPATGSKYYTNIFAKI